MKSSRNGGRQHTYSFINKDNFSFIKPDDTLLDSIFLTEIHKGIV